MMKTHTLLHIMAVLLAALLLCGTLTGCGGVQTSFTLPTRTLVGEETYTFGSYTYQLYDDDAVKILDYSGSESNLVIPDTIDGKTVVTIGHSAFLGNETIQSVKLNKNLEIIEAYAFCACTSLTSVTIGNRVWSIGEFAFEQTPWLVGQSDEFVIVGDGVLLLYQGTSGDVKVPAGVKHLSTAFAGKPGLSGVEIGDEVLTVGDYAFAYNPELRRVSFGTNVCSIGAYAFDGCTYLPYIDLPDGVERIGDYAFNECNYLVDLDLGKSLRTIGQYAFKYCSRMVCITMPATVEKISSYAFADCYSLALVYYGGGEEQFNALGLDGSNVYLKDAHLIYEGNGGNQ